ncbi:MAG: UvrD-helicase domain-containing protein, partial [Verrucomicrobiota bacterium]|nr:UvrD-helicase domain-containing protein [Verrucomicrobiota bacterium]
MATAMDRPPPIQNAALAASAGTGKTFALSNRYLALLAAGADPASIAALTFTRKAAGEILARILSRLAAAAASPAQARLLQDQLAQAGLPGFADQAAIQQALRRLAHALPRLHIGTLDSFFLQILKPFRLEYGIGVDIQIRQEATSAEEHPVLQHILDRVHLSAEEQAELMEVFKHSTFGEEAKSVYTSIRNLIHHQFELFQRAPDATHWGNPARIWPDTGGRLLQPPPTVSWEMVRSAVEQQKQAARTETERKNWDALLENFLSVEQGADYTLDHAFFKNLYRLFAQPTEEARSVRIGNAKPVALLEETRKALTEAFGAIRHLFLLKHIIRTHGLHGLLRTYAAGHWEHAAQTGHLSFQDVAHLLSPSSRRVPPHLRAQLDFRLDARFQHWLLDEFQDTSLVQWSVLENLMDEILQNPSGEHTLFYVGDTKQAIYEWRAGDPRLFHRILNKYNRPGRPPVIEEAPPLTRSWRSAPVILETLNTVFGRLDQVSPKTTELLEDWTHVVRLWMQEWTPHEAAESNHSLLGHAALYCLPPDDGEEPGGSRLQTLELLRQLQRQVPMFSRYSVAILTRSNKEGLRLRDFLAAEGIRTAWAGNSPLLDNALIPAVLSFAKLIEHPGDTLARRHVDMSLLAPLLPSAAPLSCRTLAAWGRLIREEGYAGFCAELASRLNLTHAPLEAGRLHSLMTLALEFDRRSAPTALQFLSFVETQELPGLQTGSNIHILTMHKSKGLEYDVVILPALGEKGITANAKKDVLLQEEGTHEPIPPVNWILSSPETSVIQADPTLGGRLAQDRRHRALEELRLLYVAMTRAKRAVYLLTSAPS